MLFDIDGTLVLTGRAGIRAMNRACEELVGHAMRSTGFRSPAAPTGSSCTTRSARSATPRRGSARASCATRYVAHLREEIAAAAAKGVKAVMPGIRPLLDALAARRDVFLGLLTGNFEAGARIKLEHFDLWRYFRCGAFGDDAADRNALVPFALERARGVRARRPSRRSDVFVVGDTPHDVACARAVGAVPVGVATGTFSVGRSARRAAPTSCSRT